MAMKNSWSALDWMNRGGELLDPDPWLAKRLLARGLQIEPGESIAWFNSELGCTSSVVFLQLCAPIVTALAFPTAKTEQARETISHKIYSAWPLAGGMESLRPAFYPQTRKPSSAQTRLGPSHRGPLDPNRSVLLMSEQGFETHCNSADTPSICNSKDWM